jgi:hypothetical protein
LLRVTLADVFADGRYKGGDASVGGFAEFAEPLVCLARLVG